MLARSGKVAGTHMIMARLANSNVSDAQPMTFVADKDRAVVVLQTSKAEIIGNGVDETTLTATVKDPSNHPVAGIWGITRLTLVFNQICIGHLVPQTQANNT